MAVIRFNKNMVVGVFAVAAAVVVSLNVFQDESASIGRPRAHNTVSQQEKVRLSLDKTLPPAMAALTSQKKAPTTRPAPKVLESKEATIEQLQEVSTTYDPAGLLQIRPYLENPDPDIRAAAVEAMIVLGDASAGTMLREAAKKTTSIEESKNMEEAARYVELPSADIRNLFKSQKKTGL